MEASDDAPITEDATPADGLTTAAPLPPPSSKPQVAPDPGGNCHLTYPDFCTPAAPPDLNCTSPLIAGRKNFAVCQPDPHNFDADRDGVGCERR